MQRKTVILILAMISSLSLAYPMKVFSQVNQKKFSFRAPINIDLFLAGNFGEVRSNHFHSGIDIKTQGKTGEPVFSVEDGYVSRIKVEPGGYGNAIYLKHPNGYTSLYGHLQEFAPEIADYVIKQQYRLKSFKVDLYPEAGTFQVNKSDQIAVSGNSGSSMGPHLHFELRDSQTENPVNPLLFSLDVKDNRKPEIYSANFYRLKGGPVLKTPVKYHITGGDGQYHITGKQPIPVDKSFGLGIETIDFLNGSSNKCGVFSIKMFVDGQLYFNSRNDEFSFAESRYINSFIDYREFMEKGTSMYKTFIDPNNHLSIYQFAMNNGHIDFQDEEIHKISFEVEDVAGNLSNLEFNVRKDTTKYMTSSEEMPLYNAYFHYAEENRFEEENLIILIPSQSLYTNLYFRYESEPAPAGAFSRLHKIHNESVPLQQSYKLSIKPDSLPEELN